MRVKRRLKSESPEEIIRQGVGQPEEREAGKQHACPSPARR
jgi:hypothetical protein